MATNNKIKMKKMMQSGNQQLNKYKNKIVYNDFDLSLDVKRVIHKWDIYYVDLGNAGSGSIKRRTINKNRPCIIISSEITNMIPGQVLYTVLPIKTQHTTNETHIDKYSIYHDIKINTTQEHIGQISKIAINQITTVDVKDIKNYIGSVYNKDFKMSILNKLAEFLFSEVELKVETDTSIVEAAPTFEPVIETLPIESIIYEENVVEEDKGGNTNIFLLNDGDEIVSDNCNKSSIANWSLEEQNDFISLCESTKAEVICDIYNISKSRFYKFRKEIQEIRGITISDKRCKK